MTMKTAVLTRTGFEIQDIPLPSFGDNEVLIKTFACGVCSGDVFVYQHRADYVGTYNRLGHEASGQVTAVGQNVTTFKLGDIVTALALPAYADYFVASAANLVKLPPGVNPTYALGEAVACCVHAANCFGIEPGNKVAVVGCGFMGLVCLQLAKYQGAGSICAIDPVTERLEMSLQFGAAATYNPYETSANTILAAHGEFDVVIEAAGTQSALDLCTKLVGQHGRIILVGYHQSNNGLRTVNMERWNFKAIDVINGHVRRQDEKAAAMREGMALMQKGYIITKPLVTVYDFHDIELAFHDLTSGKPGLYKAVLQMEKP